MAVYVLPTVMGLLPSSNLVPEAATAVRLRSAQVAAEVRDSLQAAKASDTTIAAVTVFIADFPHPKHLLDISGSISNPLRVGELGPGWTPTKRKFSPTGSRSGRHTPARSADCINTKQD